MRGEIGFESTNSPEASAARTGLVCLYVYVAQHRCIPRVTSYGTTYDRRRDVISYGIVIVRQAECAEG